MQTAMTLLTPVVPMDVQPAHIKSSADALRFLLAGNAYVTFRSHKSDVHFTYHVEANKHPTVAGGSAPTHFVSVLVGSDNTKESNYSYLGCIYQSRFYKRGERSKITAAAKSAMAFPWVWARLVAGRVPETCDVYHEGRCGRCGRRLTHPESIETGMGPECIKKAEGGR